MRDTISWRKDLCKKLRNSDELQQHVVSSLVNADTKVQQRELKRLAQLIADVELGLTLLKEVAPEEPATSVEALLKGYHFPVEQLQSDRNWQLIQNARVGLLNVGKSTLLEILIYHSAKQGHRCGLMVNDVATAVRLASLFCHKLGIPAAPVLGSKRQEQLAKVYEPILKSEGKEITKGGMHPAWRWFSPVCPLLALVQSEDKWEFGNEPCHKLYQKVPVPDNDDSDDEYWQESDEKYTCPFYYKCPRHHLEHDIAIASVWIFTPASFIHTRVPRQGFEQDLTFAEAVYRECKYLFVDEADRVQIQFDEEFAPDEVLVDASGNSFLNKLGLNSATIYNSDRGDMAGDRFVAWTTAHYNTQNATNRIYHLLLFAILVTILDNRLGFIVDNLSDLGRVINLHDSSQNLLHRPPDDFLPVLPESPVGNILGFLYKQERSAKKAGKLDYFRYVGVGRALLLNFPKLFAVDDWDGPHTVLISGTSYAPGSPAYHINIKPTILLQPRTGEAGIAESQFFFSPKQNSQANYIALSGLPPAKRKLAAKEMVEAMCYSVRGGESFLDGVFQDLEQRKQQQPEWWSDRDRILIVVGSYDESEWVTSILQSRYRFDVNINDDGIATLRRDNAPTHLPGIPRSEIRNLQHLPTQIVVAPLMALERGHNILNAQGKAAFGAVLFLNRPMPIPDSWQSTVQQLNAWALKHEKDSTLYEEAQSISGNLTLTQVADIFYQNAVAEMVNLNYTAWAFKQLTQGERSVLCWTQLVSIWQIIGRLVRGGVPAVVHFIDVKFAPNSAIGEQDSESTSLLVAIIKVLEPYVEGEDVLARSLYLSVRKALYTERGTTILQKNQSRLDNGSRQPGRARILEIALIHHPEIKGDKLAHFVHSLRSRWPYFANDVSLPLPFPFAIKAKEYAISTKDPVESPETEDSNF